MGLKERYDREWKAQEVDWGPRPSLAPVIHELCSKASSSRFLAAGRRRTSLGLSGGADHEQPGLGRRSWFSAWATADFDQEKHHQGDEQRGEVVHRPVDQERGQQLAPWNLVAQHGDEDSLQHP
jgi:hypothetical protein